MNLSSFVVVFFFNVVFIFLPVQAAPLCERLFGGQITGDVCKLVGYEHPWPRQADTSGEETAWWSVHRQQELLKHHGEASVKGAHCWVHWAEGGSSSYSHIMWISQITVAGNRFVFNKMQVFVVLYLLLLHAFLISCLSLSHEYKNETFLSLPPYTKECVPVIWDRLLCRDSHLQCALYC